MKYQVAYSGKILTAPMSYEEAVYVAVGVSADDSTHIQDCIAEVVLASSGICQTSKGEKES